MRVLIDYRPALRERSGVGEYTHQLVRALAASHSSNGTLGRLELTVFSSSWKDRLDRSASGLPANVAIVDRRVPVSLLNLAWHRAGWPSAEALAGGDFDVTHAQHPLLMPSRRAAQVVTIHDLNFLKNPERTRSEIRRDYPALSRSHANRADRIVVPSTFTADEVEQLLGVPRERIAICPPGAPEWRRRTAAVAPDSYILFIGTLEPRKNLGGLLDAYEQLLACRDLAVPRLVIAGKAIDESAPTLARIFRPPLAGRVQHIGYVDPSRRQELYEGARLLVQPSFEEGFGLPVLEAMTLGVPVVSSNRGALPEVLGDAGPLVPPDRPSEMANAIASILRDKAYADACAARGVARAAQFTWTRTADAVYAAYEGALARHAGTRGTGAR